MDGKETAVKRENISEDDSFSEDTLEIDFPLEVTFKEGPDDDVDNLRTEDDDNLRTEDNLDNLMTEDDDDLRTEDDDDLRTEDEGLEDTGSRMKLENAANIKIEYE